MDTLTSAKIDYQSGFGNEFATESLPGALPKGRNSPQKAPYGLYAEQLSGTAFTAPRETNQRSWLYRIRPSARHQPFARIDNRLLRSTPFDVVAPSPNRLRWDPLPIPKEPTDFIDGLVTYMGNGDSTTGTGIAIHIYAANCSMVDRCFYNSDGEMIFVPQIGRLGLVTEMGKIEVAPNQIAIIQRGIKFRVELLDGPSRGYVGENYGAMFRLPSLGTIGSNGLANPRDFLTPIAAYEDTDQACELVCKFAGNLWATELDHSPLDVVAWHGNYAPYKFDLANFNTIWTVSFDHPDPSIYTVLTSPSNSPGIANVDFVIFPPRWMVGEDTFRPPWYHRNAMSEFMGLVHGMYDAKPEGFVPGGCSLHNCMTAHGPDADSFENASNAKLEPVYQTNTMAFMFEARHLYQLTQFSLETNLLQTDYDSCWQGLKKYFSGN